MRRMIYVCDKCGKEFTCEGEVRELENHKDLCFGCWQEYRKYIDAFFEVPEEPKCKPITFEELLDSEEQEKKEKPKIKNKAKEENQSESKRKPIDWDKACALKIAGWSNKYIAEELGVNRPTIDSMIYKKVEAYKNGERFGKIEEEKYEQ